MTTSERPGRRFDLRALPIAVKVGAILIVILVISGLVSMQLIRQAVRQAQLDVALDDLATLTQSQAFRIVDTLGQEIILLNRLGSSAPIQEQLQQEEAAEETAIQTDEQLRAFLQTHEEFDSVALFDREGRLIAAEPPITGGAGSEGWDWFDLIYDGGRGALLLRNPQDDHLTGLQGLHIGVPIYRTMDSEEAIGVLYGIWNMSNIVEIMQPGGELEGLLLGPDNRVLLSISEPPGTSPPADLVERFDAGGAGAFLYTNPEGVGWLYGYARLADLGLGNEAVRGLGWTVITRQPAAAIQQNTASLLERIRLALILSATIATLSVILALHRLMRPLRRLTEAAERIEEGDLSAEIPELPADEAGQLADALRSLVAQLLQRIRQLRTAVQVSRAAVLTRDVGQMLQDVAQALTTQLGYREARIYLTDPAMTNLWLQAGAGEESERLRARGHRLAVDDTSLIGRVLIHGGPEQSQTEDYLEMALPLKVGKHSLGVLYVAGERPAPMFREHVDILSLIADQLGAALENARLLEESRSSVQAIEALNRRLTAQAWEEYLGEEKALRHTLDPEQRWPDALERMQEYHEIKAETYTDAEGRSVLAAPLILRGQTVGTLAVTRPAGEGWTHDEVLLLESIASRMVMIAEGIRLVEESTRRAEREQRLNEISASLLQRAASVDSILQTALGRLSEALGSDHVSLRIGPPPVEGDHQIASGQSDSRPGSNPEGRNALSDGEGPGTSGTNGDGGLSDED